MRNLIPNCKCSECVLHPESSHGIHFIGTFRPATLLRSRGSVLPAAVKIVMGYAEGGERWLVAPVAANVAGTEIVSIP